MAKGARNLTSGRVEKKGRSGMRVIDAADARTFVEATEKYMQANTSSPEAARATLVRLGIVDKSGKLTKHYR